MAAKVAAKSEIDTTSSFIILIQNFPKEELVNLNMLNTNT